MDAARLLSAASPIMIDVMPPDRRGTHAWSDAAPVPAPLTTIIGRSAELADALALLERSRLVTLTGAGGSGKTRLAVEIGLLVQSHYPDGVAWVELAAVADPAQVIEHIAATLEMREVPGRTPQQVIVDTLRDRELLLVLDNCEHLIDVCAEFVDTLLRGCRGVSVLVTSREALGLAGERTWLVPLLPVPAASDVRLDRVSGIASVQLFIDRACGAVPGFRLSAENVEAVVDICRRLDGMPLALELAAARVKVFGPEQIAERLHTIVALAPTNSRGLRARHRTLRETIEWSYRLLTPAEQRLFARLSVFAGSFSVEGIEAVCADAVVPREQIVDVISALVDKSLVTSELKADRSRFRLLETMRQYARDRLDELGELDTLRQRLADHCVAVTEAVEPRLFAGGSDPDAQALVGAEAPNIRAVEEWTRTDPARTIYALRLGAAVHWFWFAHGRFGEGRAWLERALAAPADVPPLVRARALNALAYVAIWQGDGAAIRTPLEEALVILGTLDAPRTTADALIGRATAALTEGNLVEAARDADAALAIIDNDESTVLLSLALYWRGAIARLAGDLPFARRAFERAAAVGRLRGHGPAIAHPLYLLATVDLHEGRETDAATHLIESLAIHHDIGDRWGLFQALALLAQLASRSDPWRAARLLGASEAIQSVLGVQLPLNTREEHEQLVAAVRTRLGDEPFAAAWAAGRAMTVSEVVGYAREIVSAPVARGARREADLRVFTLGSFEVWRRSEPIPARAWGSAKARELLVLLLYHADGCSKDRAGAELWPDATPAQVRNNFHVTLHRIRRALGDGEWIVVDNDRYALNRAYRIDLDTDVFETQVRELLSTLRAGRSVPADVADVLGRYRGDFLAHEDVCETLVAKREALQRLYLQALRACASSSTRAGAHLDALTYYERLLAHDPTDEPSAVEAMNAHAAAGDAAGAHRVYQQLVAALRRDVDAAPQPETVAAFRKVVDVSAS